ncbi:hypothetical protein PMAYCL1PPCAC_11969, partial [Pristionchus mayeri]
CAFSFFSLFDCSILHSSCLFSPSDRCSPLDDRMESDETSSLLTVHSHFTRSSLRSSLIKKSGRSPSRKTVSFSSRRNDHKQISNVSDCWQLMQNGTELVKLRSNVRHFRRLFSLDADLSHIRWAPTNKKPHKARISIDSIREVRVGRNTELLRASESALNDLQEECTFSVIYGDEYECLDLVADSADDANIWVTGLIALTSNRLEKPTTSSLAMLRERWLESVFEEEDREKRGEMGEKEAVRAIASINRRLPIQRIKAKFKEMSVPSEENADVRRINKENFVELYKELSTRPELYFLMVRYANKDYLSCQDLRLFLETEQGLLGVSTDLCESIIDQYEPCPEAKENNVLTIDGFTAYLLSSECSLFDSSRSVVWQDMKQPLTRYFIAASHRPFLVEEQQGAASVDGIIAALKRSSRWIELEIWNPEEGEEEPRIQRGPTTNNKIGLRCALETIKEYAFERSRYPVFLRLVVHCKKEWQRATAALLREKLAKRLYIPSDDPTDWSKNKPTPFDFQMKIIVVCKRLPSSSKGDGDVTEDDEIPPSARRINRRLDLAVELSSLSAPFLVPKACSDLMSTAPNSHYMSPSTHLPHIPESVALRLMHTYPAEFAQTTRDYSVVISPNLSRLDSSNLNPQEFWNHGCQIVEMNYQTPGLMMDLQEGKFSENGCCGYVLKPEILNDALFTPGDKIPTTPQILHIRILSGQQLPRPRGSSAKGDSSDPFVVVEIFGVSGDCTEDRTKTVKNESNPAFDESFQFQITVPELALVRFLVLDDEYIEDDFIGQYTIPFECLQPGFHHVPLLNSEGDPLEQASLFVHVALTNKRGGGKAKKRGMSVKRKQQKITTGMKAVGIKSVDDLFKTAGDPLSNCISMRLRLETCMIEWQEECGLGPTGTIRQGIRLIHSRMTTLALNSSPPSTPRDSTNSGGSDAAPSFQIDVDDKQIPSLIITGQLPDQLNRTFEKLRALLSICSEITHESDGLLTKMEDATSKLSTTYEKLSLLCTEAGLRGQKAIRAGENFTWNLRVLKAQLSLLNRTQDEANDIIAQVFETARVLSVLSDRLQHQSKGRRFSRVLADPLNDSLL